MRTSESSTGLVHIVDESLSAEIRKVKIFPTLVSFSYCGLMINARGTSNRVSTPMHNVCQVCIKGHQALLFNKNAARKRRKASILTEWSYYIDRGVAADRLARIFPSVKDSITKFYANGSEVAHQSIGDELFAEMVRHGTCYKDILTRHGLGYIPAFSPEDNAIIELAQLAHKYAPNIVRITFCWIP